MLRKLLRANSNASHIHRAVRGIREDFRVPLYIGELDRSVGMRESAFHRHFKSITGTTPLQYQKRMRLLEARRIIATQAYPVSSAAFEVGYASPTQFRREYSRDFGAAPREHGSGRWRGASPRPRRSHHPEQPVPPEAVGAGGTGGLQHPEVAGQGLVVVVGGDVELLKAFGGD
jgi:AraC-like DNA-binding protein